MWAMPQNSVVIRYGAYESCGVVKHSTFRLEGLQAALNESGYQCVLQPTCDWNMVELVINGECVYTCNIKQLEFGGDGKLDPLCKRALAAVKDAY
ncbi:UPF0728 protein C10orf53 homolog isoform X1 [Hypomesus transpacificus]|uniref:UPF0728 protein C10orf53 homolog isoform X1 n=2 Tax=Hypomesus transpacificus TaxID=137520 RepID=UPI001F07A386|nr:UPF0728 protein C10orf53 homolog isoform X1 [Hypomesus transpacificus]